MARLTSGKLRALTLLTGLAALAACGEQGAGGGKWFREAGAQLDGGEFGNATMQNMVAQVCFPQGRGGAYGAGKIGSVPGDPVVVIDPESTPRQPVYRVHCDGRLDGKYARIIYRDYVSSAGQAITVTAADAE
ncbi:hypothetical protein [Roseobacter sinensis]|uniref:Lipoprotein n=1 Tax=Roseobacter sinensis TaxID=2931391 RepID=A0ABT3BH55_9RHOB|nr:hypothetical protein [Roseobacter sp. WL0113]MCV3272870.1 hypothetical protein [Roseobacter sp. WL0113]